VSPASAPESNVFRLPSLHLGTEFDDPIVPLEVPGTLGRGSDSALCILDGANRAPHRLSRMVRPVGLLGIKLADPSAGVRITMRLLVDDLATSNWDRHMFALRGEPMPDEEEYVPSDVSTRHRLVEVTAQGRSRALAVMALRPTDDDHIVRQHLSFELSAEEVGDSGLVMIGLDHPRHAPGWSRENELEDSLVGVCVARLIVDPLDERVRPHALTGRPGVEHTPVAAANPGFFVVNPPGDGGPSEVTVTPRGAGGERLLGRRAKVKHPVRYARELAEDRRVATSTPAVVEVVDLQGETLLDTTLEAAGGRHTFTVPAGAGPVFVRARKVLDGQPRNVDWSVRVKKA
jgi:hypothetical protein